MNRVKGTCVGDCSKCELLLTGEVDMIPCILDQIFRRVQKNEKEMESLKSLVSTEKKVTLVGEPPEEDSV